MFVILKSAIASIRRQKMQTLLVGIVLVFVSVLLFTGLSLTFQPKAYKTVYERANATHSVLLIPNDNEYIEQTTSLFDKSAEVEDIQKYDTVLSEINTTINGKDKSAALFLTAYNSDEKVDKLYVNEDEIATAPKDNEMLLSYTFAKSIGIQKGDNVDIVLLDQTYSFFVSDLIVDPQYSSNFINPTRAFISSDFFSLHSVHPELCMVFVKYYEPEVVDEVAFFEEFNTKLNTNVIPTVIFYKDFKLSYEIVQTLISSIFIAVSILILLIVVFVIRSIIQDTILKKFKQIGVKKALGYTEKQIKWSMIIQYGIIGIIASLIGSVLGITISRGMSSVLNADFKIHISAPIVLLIPATVMLITGLLIFFSYRKINKLKQIKPVQAIKYGIPEMNFASNSYDISTKKQPLLFLIAVKDIVKNKRKSFANIFLIVLLIFPTLVLYNISYSVSDKQHFANNIIGLKVGDYAVSNDTQDNAQQGYEKIKQIEAVDSVVLMNYSSVFANTSIECSDGSKQSIMENVIYGDVQSDFVTLKEGRQMEVENEICITSLVANETNKSVGDYITIYGRESNDTYLISGIYTSINLSGYSFVRMEKNVPQELMQNQVAYWIYTDDELLDLSELDSRVKEELGDNAAATKYDSYLDTIVSSMDFLPVVISAMLVIFIAINSLIVLNFTLMEIGSATKKYGIMKAIGFTKGNIVRILLTKTIITVLSGGILALILNFVFADMIMQFSISMTYSIISLSVIHNVYGSIGLVLLFIAISAFSTLIPSKRIGAVSPRQLISE